MLARAASTPTNSQYDSLFISNYIDLFCATPSSACPASATSSSSASASTRCASGSTPRLAGRGLTAADVVSALREQNVQVAAGQVGEPPAPRRARCTRSACAPSGRLTRARGVRGHHPQGAAPDGDAGAREGRRPRRAGRREPTRRTCASSAARRSGIGVTQLPDGQRARGLPTASWRSCERLSKSFPPGSSTSSPSTTTTVVSRVDQRGADDAARGHRPRHPRDVPVPAELAEHGHPGDHDSGVARRHLRVRQAVQLLDQHADAVRHRRSPPASSSTTRSW